MEKAASGESSPAEVYDNQAAARPALFVDGALGAQKKAGRPGLAAFSAPSVEAKTAPPAPRRGSGAGPGKTSADGAAVGFMGAFMAVLSPAMAIDMLPVVGRPLGTIAAALLFIPAVLAGCVGALIGWLF